MKVLITRSSENETIGGAELSARDQAIALQSLGHEPIFSGNSKLIRDELKSMNIKAHGNLFLQRFTPPMRYLYFWLLLLPKVMYDLLLVLRTRPDIINPHTREDQISFTLTKPFHRRPVVWKDPGDMRFTLQPATSLLGAVYRNLYLAAARRADHIYTLTQDYANEITKLLGDNTSQKVSAIPSSILYSYYDVRCRPSSGGEIIIGSICRLDKYKNIDLLIQAYINSKSRITNTKLIITGEGPERGNLENIAAGHDDIIFKGYTSDPSQSLSEIEIFVHPASVEGWGRSIKEAMYFGKAIIGSRVGGIAKQIDHGHTGLLFDSGDVDQLAEQIVRLAQDDKLRQQLGANAAMKAKKDGDFINIVEHQILPIYHRAINRPR